MEGAPRRQEVSGASKEFMQQLLTHREELLRYAKSLPKGEALPEDLVQDTLMRALASHHTFIKGSNMGAWLFTILRNRYREIARRSWRTVEDPEGSYEGGLSMHPAQETAIDVREQLDLIKTLKPEHQKILHMAAQELEYKDMAGALGISEKAVKSLMNRARSALARAYKKREARSVGGASPTQ